MYKITKQFGFEASHCLTHLKEGHPCRNVHGHSYKVELELQSEILNKEGMIIDYRDLDWVKKWIEGTFDHRHLNDVLKEKEGWFTTSENLALFIYRCLKSALPELSAVTVKETEKTSARYEE